MTENEQRMYDALEKKYDDIEANYNDLIGILQNRKRRIEELSGEIITLRKLIMYYWGSNIVYREDDNEPKEN